MTQEKIDRDDRGRCTPSQTDLERTRSQVVDSLLAGALRARHGRMHHRGRQDLDPESHRRVRRRGEGDGRPEAEVQSLKANNTQLMGRLQSLRDQFQETYHKNVEMLGKGQ